MYPRLWQPDGKVGQKNVPSNLKIYKKVEDNDFCLQLTSQQTKSVFLYKIRSKVHFFPDYIQKIRRKSVFLKKYKKRFFPITLVN